MHHEAAVLTDLGADLGCPLEAPVDKSPYRQGPLQHRRVMSRRKPGKSTHRLPRSESLLPSGSASAPNPYVRQQDSRRLGVLQTQRSGNG